MSEEQAAQILHVVKLAVSTEEMKSQAGPLEFAELTELSQIEQQILVEKHLVSPQHVESPENRAVMIASDESVSIMVNEEDHLRIQCLLPGLQIEETWITADKIDDLVEETLTYSFCEQRGYLTSCPTNVGTGLRASVMLHLPCLVMAKQVGQIVNALSHLGLAVRGYYGEGTEAYGNLFQVSNQVTMGQTEEEIVRNLLTVTRKIITQEKSTREMIFEDNKSVVEDRVYRALGVMKYARTMTSREALKHISNVRFGLELGILQKVSFERINELIMMTRPAFLSKRADRQLTSEECDLHRADVIRELLEETDIY